MLVYNPPPAREELSLSFSSDDAKTWTKPIVLARQKDGQLSYPYVIERRARRTLGDRRLRLQERLGGPLPLRLKFSEQALVQEAAKAP